jgi:hypothetical protein
MEELKIYEDGTKRWLKDRKCHREDGPAVKYADGTKQWYVNGKVFNQDFFHFRKLIFF